MELALAVNGLSSRKYATSQLDDSDQTHLRATDLFGTRMKVIGLREYASSEAIRDLSTACFRTMNLRAYLSKP